MTTYGWFHYEPHPDRVTKPATGQCLTIVASRDSPEGDSFDVTYTDNGFECPLRLTNVRRPYSLPDLTLEYPTTFADTRHYGRWRRIDEFAVDALLCWPMLVDPRAGCGLVTVGGWRSGVWQPKLRRRFAGGKVIAVDKPNPAFKVAEPVLLPLDLPLPAKWRAVDMDWPRTKVRLDFERLEGSGIPFLPRAQRVSGFQGRVPYLEREDGEAFIFFTELEPATYRDGEAETHLHYTYVDPDVFFTFQSAPRWGLSLGGCSDYGYREVPPRRELWPTDMLGNVYPWDQPVPLGRSYLSYPMWLRTMNVLHDAWPAWGRSPRPVKIDPAIKLPENYGRIGHVGNYGPRMSHGYSAGYMNHVFDVSYS